MAAAEEKKKPSLALVIAAGKPKGKPEGDDEAAEGEEESDDGSYAAAADELFDALKSGDREAFADALRAAVMSCK